MKKIKIFMLLILCTLFISFSLTTIYAHRGRTDSSGGHYNRSTGEYHYHHGYSAHQHPNGICPYSNSTINDNNTTSTSSAKSYKDSTTNDETSNKSYSKNYNEMIEKIQEKEKTNTKNNDNGLLGWLCFAIFGSITGLAIYQSNKELKRK